jgi:hypothetical protein
LGNGTKTLEDGFLDFIDLYRYASQSRVPFRGRCDLIVDPASVAAGRYFGVNLGFTLGKSKAGLLLHCIMTFSARKDGA